MPSSSLILSGGALCLLALSSLNSKIAGTLWGLAFIIGGILAWRNRPLPPQDAIDRVALAWLGTASISLICWTIVAVIWNELYPLQSAEINAGARLATGALATWWLVRAALVSNAKAADQLTIATAIAALVALTVSAVVPDRDHYPSNVIAWSGAIGFLACILLGRAVDARTSHGIRWLSALGTAAALLAIIGGQRRGIYPVIVWVLAVAAVVAYRRVTNRRRIAAVGLLFLAALGLGLGLAAQHHSDPLRLQEASRDLHRLRDARDFNTSTGARVYLFELGWRTFTESPWIGIGARNRRALIQQSGQGESAERVQALQHVRDLGHVHNAYLHHAMDGGLIGLSGFLVSVAGLVVLARMLRAFDPIASLQAYGLAFVHGVTNLTSVNLAHNYYALMLAISVALVVIQARLLGARPPPSPAHNRLPIPPGASIERR